MEEVMGAKYVDSFVMPVSKSKVGDYQTFAEKMATLAEKHGALEYVNSIADDVKPGKVTSFPQAVKLADDEVVVISWAVYKSREDRDRANKAIMEDEDFKQLSKNLPVDGKRMFTGGFKVLRGL
jgi:uncharacterized protein YbaA (DUF1428 family)